MTTFAFRSGLNVRSTMAMLTIAAGLATMLALAGCSPHPSNVVEPGSYAAANTSDCLPAITLVDQHGQDVSLASLKGHPVLIDFIYSTCPGPCPLMTSRMAVVAKLLGHKLGSQVTFVSITIDPEHDRPAELEKYARESGADAAGWLFLTGTPAQIDRVLAIYHLRADAQSRRHRESRGGELSARPRRPSGAPVPAVGGQGLGCGGGY